MAAVVVVTMLIVTAFAVMAVDVSVWQWVEARGTL